MKHTEEKKFFFPILKHYDFDISKRWRVEYLVPTHNGIRSKRVVKYGNINKGKTTEERLERYQKLVDTLVLGKKVSKEKKLTILHTAIEKNVFMWRKKTIEAYSTVINEYTQFSGNIKPEKATELHIQNFLLHLHHKKKSKNTIAKYRNTLYTIYKKAIELKLCDSNPVVSIPFIKRNPKSLNFFTDSQIEAIKEVLAQPKYEQLRLCVQLAYYCFIRNNEIRNLKINDINFDYAYIEILSDSAKNARTQKVQIPQSFLKEIQYLKNYSNNNFIVSKELQPSQTPVSTKWIYAEHKKILEQLKIRGRYSFYSWKHTGVVKAVKAGINIKDLQLQLRHHSLDMVNEYLKNLGVMDSKDIRNKFPAL